MLNLKIQLGVGISRSMLLQFCSRTEEGSKRKPQAQAMPVILS